MGNAALRAGQCPKYGGHDSMLRVRKTMLSFRTRIFCSVFVAALIASGIAVYYGRASLSKVRLILRAKDCCAKPHCRLRFLTKSGQARLACANWQSCCACRKSASLLDNAGNVLADTAPGAQPVSKLDNHADRPEVRAAMQGTDRVFLSVQAARLAQIWPMPRCASTTAKFVAHCLCRWPICSKKLKAV